MPDERSTTGERRTLDPFAGIERIGRYDVVRRVGAGAMGIVFEARDERMGRRVALKVLTRPQGLSDKSFEEYRSRFFREAQTAGGLNHPNIVVIYDVDVDEALGLPFMAMEFLEGISLDGLLEEGVRMSRAKALDVGIQVGEALAHAHQRGVVHRDVKPANLILQSNGKVTILDFGIAKIETSQLTQSGQFLGTPNYVSPEQLRDGDVTGRSDLFSLGVILYELLAGKRPFAGKTVMAVAYQICNTDPPPPSSVRPQVSEGVDRVVMGLLAKEPDERPASGKVVAAALREELDALGALGAQAEHSGPVSDGDRQLPKELTRTLTVIGSSGSPVEEELREGASHPGIAAPARTAHPDRGQHGAGHSSAGSTAPPRPAPPRARPLSATAPPGRHFAAAGRGASKSPWPMRLAVGGLTLVILVLVAVIAWPDTESEPTPPTAAVRAVTAAEAARAELRTFYLPEGATHGTPLREPYLRYLGGAHAEAAREFERVARNNPEVAEARLLQGISLVLAGDSDAAVEPLETVVAAHPRHEAARWYLAQALFATGRDAEALELVESLAEEGGPLADSARRVLAAGG